MSRMESGTAYFTCFNKCVYVSLQEIGRAKAEVHILLIFKFF